MGILRRFGIVGLHVGMDSFRLFAPGFLDRGEVGIALEAERIDGMTQRIGNTLSEQTKSTHENLANTKLQAEARLVQFRNAVSWVPNSNKLRTSRRCQL